MSGPPTPESFVDTKSDPGVATGTEDGGGAGIGVDPGEVLGREREAALRVVDGCGAAQEKSATRLIESSLFATDNQRAKLERSMDVFEEDFLILEIKQAGNAPCSGDRFEESGGGFVGIDTGRSEQTDDAVGLDEVHGTLHEKRVKVDVASTEQRIVAGVANPLAQLIRPLLRRVEFLHKGISLVT